MFNIFFPIVLIIVDPHFHYDNFVFIIIIIFPEVLNSQIRKAIIFICNIYE